MTEITRVEQIRAQRQRAEAAERVVEAVRPLVAYPVGSFAQQAFEDFREDVLKQIAAYDATVHP